MVSNIKTINYCHRLIVFDLGYQIIAERLWSIDTGMNW